MESKDLMTSIQVSKSNLAKAIMRADKDQIEKVSILQIFLCIGRQNRFFLYRSLELVQLLSSQK